VTIHRFHHVTDESDTYEDIIRFWQRLDEPLTSAELREFRHPRTAGVVVAARILYALLVLTILVCLPLALRAVGHALE
jgi:hypothetical protein